MLLELVPYRQCSIEWGALPCRNKPSALTNLGSMKWAWKQSAIRSVYVTPIKTNSSFINVLVNFKRTYPIQNYYQHSEYPTDRLNLHANSFKYRLCQRGMKLWLVKPGYMTCLPVQCGCSLDQKKRSNQCYINNWTCSFHWRIVYPSPYCNVLYEYINETFNHILSWCNKLDKKVYKSRHDWGELRPTGNWANEFDLATQTIYSFLQFYMQKPKTF